MKNLLKTILRRTLNTRRFLGNEAHIRRAIDELHEKYYFNLTKF